MKTQIKVIRLLVLISVIWLALPISAQSFPFDTDLRGHVQTTFIIRDDDGFQHGFFDHARPSQLRTELKFDLTVKPKYARGKPNNRVEKIFLSYRGAYDAILEASRYDDIRDKSPHDFELGKDDILWENDLREGFIDLVSESQRTKLNLRLGRQIVQWGESDGFNLMNVVNPNDQRSLLFFDNPEDLATPLWMARLDYRVDDIGFFDTLTLELLGIPDIRPTQYAPLDLSLDAPYAFTFLGFKGFIMREDVEASTLDNMEIGAKLEGTIGGLTAALHYFDGYKDDPAIDWTDAFTTGTLWFRHPDQKIYGYSFNYFVTALNAVVRGEGSLTDKDAYMDVADPSGTWIGERKTYQVLFGFDKSLWIKWLNPRDMIGTAWQVYWRHIDDWDHDNVLRPLEKENRYRLTTYWFTDYYHGKISPEIFIMHDTNDKGTWMTSAGIKYSPDGKWYYKLSQISFWGDNKSVSPFATYGLIKNSEVSFRIGYNF